MKSCERIVRSNTSDEIVHTGVVIEPERKMKKAVVWVHGLYQNAFDEPSISIGRHMAKNGYLFVSGNNRGHDFGTLLKRKDKEPLAGGGGWEKFEDSDKDIDAWVNFLIQTYKVDEIILIGHSFGTLKSVYYMYKRKNPHIKGMVLLSTSTTYRGANPTLEQIATKLLKSGNGRDLIPWPEYGCSMSAETYLRHQDKNSIFRNLYVKNGPISEISVPILVIGGGNEPEIDKRLAEYKDIQRFASNATSVDVAIAKNADHYYTNEEIQVANVIIQWIKTI